MITRETKVGLVVAGSFLSLVGIVLASKLRQGENANAETAQAETLVTPARGKTKKPVPGLLAKNGSKKNTSQDNAERENKDGAAGETLPEKKNDLSLDLPRSAHHPGPEPLADPGKPMPRHLHQGGSLEVKTDEGSGSAELPDPAKTKHKKNEDNLDLHLPGEDVASKPASGGKHDKGLEEPKDKDPKKQSVLDGLGFDKAPKGTTEKVASGQPSKDKDLGAPVGSTNTGAEKARTVKGPTTMPVAVNPDKPKESLSLGDGSGKPTNSDTMAATRAKETGTVQPLDKDVSSRQTDPKRTSVDVGSAERTRPDLARPIATGGTSTGHEDAAVKPVASLSESARPPKALPPLGSSPTVATPPIALPSSAGGGTPAVGSHVDTWEVEQYAAAQGDTFATISKKFYKTEKYEQALLKYNRDYNLDAGFDPTTTLLAPGKPVVIPDLSVLERRYSDMIPGYKPAAPAPAAAIGGTEHIQSSADKGPMATTPVVQVSTKKNTQPGLSYQVQQDGETFWTIAQKTLAKGERWSEISHLNGDQYDPKSPVPRGTLLRLPADARVERTDKP